MKNIKFEQNMISDIRVFKRELEERCQIKQIIEINKRYDLIQTVAKLYDMEINTVVFYKNPFLFTMKDTYGKDEIKARVEGNKCFIEVNRNNEIKKSIINFTTKRYLML